MQMMRSIQNRWDELNAAERREEDERGRLMRLVATRDAFISVLVLLVGLLVAQFFLTGEFRQGPVVPAILALFPLAAITTAGLVWIISWRIRSGGVDARVAAFRGAKTAAGFAVGLGIVLTLSWSGALPLTIELWPFLGIFSMGLALVAVLVGVLSKSGDRV